MQNTCTILLNLSTKETNSIQEQEDMISRSNCILRQPSATNTMKWLYKNILECSSNTYNVYYACSSFDNKVGLPLKYDL